MKKKMCLALFFIIFSLFICTCDYGDLGGADVTDDYQPGDETFIERLDFLCGVWYSHYAGIGRLDGYRIRKWGDITVADRAKMQSLFPAMNSASPITCASRDTPHNSDYVLLYDATVYGQQDDGTGGTEIIEGTGYMGFVRAINLFYDNPNRGALIIEYFEGADPIWLSNTQGLARGEKPFFGIYYRVLNSNTVQMANAVDLAAMNAGERYYTEKATLQEAIDYNTVENEAEFISWGVVIPQERE